MSHNTFGHLFRVTTWGESHGPALGCVVDGCPPRIEISEAEIQGFLDRRKPGQSRFTTQRREPDAVKILSGVMPIGGREGSYLTTGAPISLMIENVDQRSKDYSEIKDRYRPGHADFTYDANTASATTAVAAVPRRAKPRPASRRARSPARSSPA
jgi:chorismate synthase